MRGPAILVIDRACTKSPLGRQSAKPDHDVTRWVPAGDERPAAADPITQGWRDVQSVLARGFDGDYCRNCRRLLRGNKCRHSTRWRRQTVAARSLGGTALRATLEREAPKGSNPVALTDANLIAGIGLYAKNCAICHGTAKGDASITPLAKGMYIPPPQLASEGVEDDPEGYTFWKVKHGIRWTAMPAWEGTLNDEQIWTLALFLKHMDKLPPAAEQAWQQVTN